MKSALSSSGVALLFFGFLVTIGTINISFCNGITSYVGCIASERKALLRFKGDLIDPSNRLASWIGDEDCCRWAGVVCDNFTGHVLQLYLRNPMDIFYAGYESSRLIGKINPSLLDLKHLVYLDLSGNNFSGIQIPRFLGFMTNLRFLNLSNSRFEGLVPPQLGNISNLQYLDLNQHYSYELSVENLNWISGLSVLEHLDLSFVNLRKASDWLLDMNTLPHLLVLKLSFCELQHFPPLPIANFSSLATLDLHFNRFQGLIPGVLQNFTSLKHLDLSWNDFNSSIPNWFYRFSHLEYLSLSGNSFRGATLGNIANLTSLEILDLSYNQLEENIPTSWKTLCNLKLISLSLANLSQDISEILDIFSGCISVGLESLELRKTQLSGHLTNQLGKLKNVHTLDFAINSISGQIPMSFGELSSLKFLDFSHNKLNGTLSEIHFFNISSLESFDVSENSLELKVIRNWIPPFHLTALGLRSCHLGPGFPSWLSSQKKLTRIDMSNSKIDDIIPNWFWKYFSQFKFLNLSHNQIRGEIPNLTMSIEILDLSWNYFSGPLPLIYAGDFLDSLDLSNNAFSGPIFHFLCIDIKEPMQTRVLNLQNNFLFGELPDCWSNWQNLEALNLGNNEFSGTIPTSMATLSALQSLHLHKNNLSGSIPLSLKNCSSLGVLDLSENKFVGNIPTWIGESLLSMTILNLHSNNFFGLLPVELCRLVQLQILYLADNKLSGTIPRCVSNFSAMITIEKLPYTFIDSSGSAGGTDENVILVVKGKEGGYSTILNLIRNYSWEHRCYEISGSN
ncbi:Leucine-rich repeat receptor protein kinase [Melia azedarach]|uniref:Leucine-rich repeat receptor protein kinase n=1 Tax=Melia azedarach TaxID=155640 RepID=A0ACC1YSM0_MELAZ|nr:Leucine-rich repeat receptor protein kinase [Melia azedarach]